MAIRMTAKEPLAQPVKAKPTAARAEVNMPTPKIRPAEKIMEGLREALAVAKGEAEPHAVHVGRGRPASGKIMVTMRLDPDVVAKFKTTGDGWQARINAALKAAKV